VETQDVELLVRATAAVNVGFPCFAMPAFRKAAAPGSPHLK
jgi:hypothetical protein